MAKKRRMSISGPEHSELQEEVGLPRKYEDVDWKEWLKVDFARYWFVTLAIAIDVLFGLDVMGLVSGIGLLGFVAFLAVAIPLEVLLYLYLWGKKGILMPRD